MYDFDTVPDRVPTGCVKWSARRELCGEEDAIPLWVADMDFPVAPEIQEAIRARAEHPIYGYPVRQDGFYESLTGWTRRRYGWEIRREWICYSPGIVPAVNLAVLAFTRPGDKVVIQSPVYYPFGAAVLNNGRRLLDNPLRLEGDRYVMDLPDLERKIDSRTKLLILCSPHNPVGRVWTREELSALAELCARKNLVVVSDEIHADIVMPGRRHTCFAAISEDAASRSLTCLAVSKTFNLAGLCTANVVIPDRRLRDGFSTAAGNLGLGTSNVFGIAAQEAAYTKGEPWLEELIRYVRGNYLRLKTVLEGGIPGIRVLPLEGTYLAWADCRGLGMSDPELKDFFLHKAKVWLDEGIKFGTGGSGFQRFNLACPRATLDAALDRILSAYEARRAAD
ncbi:MAG TPA: MalY/PatB family protein [Spirochaetia bacterium]|nr:MalY/PatB family protein [Spirochaetales bacterium]HRY80249.1 MalY/PatB family protein [Spirochaetia bacterium]HRZ88372.1 MalY/PatB family protein [Spirochaetia bacterium]